MSTGPRRGKYDLGIDSANSELESVSELVFERAPVSGDSVFNSDAIGQSTKWFEGSWSRVYA